ncbi:hypothetical protein XENTR_v10024182 [Xenopus tropicalis]|nr:fibroblast growth factor receptor substrate 2 isoform X3 [Xenopus tropicalis]XP_031748541.1 fibroblast growth factor receptor substrate 2 isoform X3 [Xenopus tropicalis]XP_031748542.1 fibroblast growth factor receptor substrate 2 isoform X3 [Xenopus tropicalis]XP_031748543.1 fibroblast growth factor receptor substrate 2 isoform X3 [Xenopus tropicalis]KAE8579787.1 hypothetical protein XENTR_v10024182 [Xenopus tropicalis]
MGLCLCSGTKHFTEEAENRFWVINVNDDGKKICPGIMELTETCLMFYPKKGGLVRWPYISLVKYGYDSNLFSFVCGRRCATGEELCLFLGIFGFRCMRAEDLFNMLQNNMQNNRISIISDTDSEFHTCAYNVPYRYETYSAVFSSSQRPEPFFGDFVGSSVTPSLDQSYMTSMYKEKRMQQRCLSVERKNSDGGMSQTSSRYSNTEAEEWNHYQKSSVLLRNQFKKDDLEILNTIGDFGYANCDTGYDSDERKERCCVKRREYENIIALPKECLRSRSLMPSVSSSDSHNTNSALIKSSEGGYESQPSSPSVFEEKYSLEQNNPLILNECNPSRQTLFKRCSFRQESLTLHDYIPTYFNFDVKQISQNAKKLNYIQVELESGCDSEHPQTPQSPDMAIPSITSQQSELYAELDLEKTAALSRIQNHRQHDDGTRKTRHNIF